MKKILIALSVLFIMAVGLQAQTSTNYFSPQEIEATFGPALGFTSPIKQQITGFIFGGIYWQTKNYGPGIHAGINDLSRPGPLLFSYSQADYNVRYPIWRFAPGGRLALGKSFTDGANYTEVDGTFEVRFTKNLGMESELGFKFTTTSDAGWKGAVQFVYAF